MVENALSPLASIHVLAVQPAAALRGTAQSLSDRFDRLLVRYDAWFLVLMAVLLTIAVVVASALAVWCLAYMGKRFTGRWEWGQRYVSVWAECV